MRTALRSSSETKGQSVGSGKAAAKAVENVQESLWDVTLKRAVQGLCECLPVTGHKKIILCPVGASIYCVAFVIFLYDLPANSTVRRTCLALTGELS